MLKSTYCRAVLALLAIGMAFVNPAASKDFTFDEKTNKEVARKLKIPVFFAVPASSRADLPSIDTTDPLIDFRHPDAADAQGDIGLRLVISKRRGLAQRLGTSGLIQTGDLLLSVRPEWGGAGVYPNIQMGISHTGIAYIKDGELHNLDNPMNAEFLGNQLRGELDGSHYKTINVLHVIRPRGLTEDQRARILDWATRLASNAKRVYPSQISFNQDYNAPKYAPGKPINFVKQLGQIALGQNPPGNIGMFCSEFTWSILALKDCDADTASAAFRKSGIPSCVKPPMQPMQATGDYVERRSIKSYAGLADGPLLVIDAMNLPEERKNKMLQTVFVNDPGRLAKLSPGHKAIAETMKPKFTPLEKYYSGIGAKGGATREALAISARFNKEVPDNYSPTSYLVNTLLPVHNRNRTMDYVATIVIE